MRLIFLSLCLIFNLLAADDCVERRTPADRIIDDHFGLVEFDIRPGYRKVLVDNEFIVYADAENILFPTGRHHLKVISAPGYRDTSFVFLVEKDIKKMIVVELEENQTQRVLRLTAQKEKARKRKFTRTVFKFNLLFLGAASASLYGYYYDQKDAWPLALMSAGFFAISLAF